MKIDPSRVNILEKDIEEWLFHNPKMMAFDGAFVTQWTLRQFALPSGKVDLVGVGSRGETVVVEVKNVEITSDALTQVSRYAADIENILHDGEWIAKIVIGRGEISDRLLFEAEALGIYLITFNVSLNLTLGTQWAWTEEHNASVKSTIRELADNDDVRYHRELSGEIKEKYMKEIGAISEADDGI